MKIAISGILGRMGKLIQECILENDKNEIAFGIDKNAKEPIDNILLSYTWNGVNKDADVIIDFSSHDATKDLINFALRNKTPIVIGTTGQTTEDLMLIHNASKKIPIILCPNTSLGANYLIDLAKSGSDYFSKLNYEIDILETHHSNKKDAPSGTALAILNSILSVAPSLRPVFNQEKTKEKNEISVCSRRIGGIIGKHEVSFASNGEIITIQHEVLDRKIFAHGAIECAKFIIKQPPGLYKPSDIFNENKQKSVKNLTHYQ